MGISPLNLHGIAQHSRALSARAKLDKLMGTLINNVSNTCNIAAITLDDSKSASKNDDIHLEASQLERLHKTMKEKLVTAPYPEKIQILTLTLDAWSRKYCAEYFNVSECLVETTRELKRVGGILAKPTTKRIKKIHKKELTFLLPFMMNLVTKCMEKRTVSVLEIKSQSKNSWYDATCVKYMLYLSKKI